LRLEAEGKMSKFKVGNLWENGKTSSERESKIFFAKPWERRSASDGFWKETDVGMVEKRFLSGEERVFSKLQAKGWRQKEKYQMSKFKIQMADDGARAKSTKHTDNEHGHATRSLSEGEFGQQPLERRRTSFSKV